MTLMFLNGTAMSGQKDHGAHAGSRFLGPARTATKYRFFAVRDEFPGLYPVESGGRVIEGELYDIPDDVLRRRLLPSEPPELELGEIELIDGERVNAMQLVPTRLHPGDKVVDISELGGFRAYQRFLAANARIEETLRDALASSVSATVLDASQLLAHLDGLAASAVSASGAGVTRLAWSIEDLAGRRLLASWAAACGVVASCDAVGNVVAELPGSIAGLCPLVAGSHLDTVIDAGPLDGAYGTVAAFEVVAALARSGERLRHPLRAVAFVNEEGIVAPAFTGSRVAVGLAVDLDAAGPDGVRLSERIASSGGDPSALYKSAWPRVAGYLELHIEQGPLLERLDVPVGVVTGITGCRRGLVTFEGRAGHAGTTPMELRQDALVAAARAVLVIDGLARSGVVEVATAGALHVHPGNANVIAGLARVSFDVRSLDDAQTVVVLERLRLEVEAIARATSTRGSLTVTSETDAVSTDPLMRQAVAEAAAGLALETTELASGAGHDAQQLAAMAPTGMIFVPSVGGVSHHPAETTAPEHLVAGVEVLLGALRIADSRLDP